MNKVKLITYVVVVLVIVNTIFLALNFLKPSKPEHQKPGGPKKMIIKELIVKKLNFNDVQAKEFELLIREHRQDILSVEKEMTNNKTALYNTILNKEISRDSILNEIGKKQIQIEQIHLAHFEQIKEICEKEQLPAFELLISEIGIIFTGPKKKKRP